MPTGSINPDVATAPVVRVETVTESRSRSALHASIPLPCDARIGILDAHRGQPVDPGLTTAERYTPSKPGRGNLLEAATHGIFSTGVDPSRYATYRAAPVVP